MDNNSRQILHGFVNWTMCGQSNLYSVGNCMKYGPTSRTNHYNGLPRTISTERKADNEEKIIEFPQWGYHTSTKCPWGFVSSIYSGYSSDFHCVLQRKLGPATFHRPSFWAGKIFCLNTFAGGITKEMPFCNVMGKCWYRTTEWFNEICW